MKEELVIVSAAKVRIERHLTAEPKKTAEEVRSSFSKTFK